MQPHSVYAQRSKNKEGINEIYIAKLETSNMATTNGGNQTKSVEISLNMDAVPKQNPPSVTVTVDQSANAFNVLQKAAQQNQHYQYSATSYPGMGELVTKIDGVPQNTTTKMYWYFYVNGTKATVGVSTYVPADGDKILMKYERDSCPNE